MEKVKPGSIVLFHNAALHTPEALPGILESLQKSGYRFVPISELIYTENYSIDQAGCQHPTAEAPTATHAQDSTETEKKA